MIVAGTFTGSIDLGVRTLVSVGTPDVFVLKLDGVGSYLWSRTFGGAQSGTWASPRPVQRT